MCFLLFSINDHPEYPLILAANRDENYRRPTQAAQFWQEHPNLIAGRDLSQGGTWLGIAKSGRLAALTNYRSPESKQDDRPSRGHLVSDYLQNDESAAGYLEKLSKTGQLYNGFNLLVGTTERLYYYSNKAQRTEIIETGIFGLSNHLLDTPWPKIEYGKQRFKTLCDPGNHPDPNQLFALLGNRDLAPRGKLPDTGVGAELEHTLSSIFISGGNYGTRCSTVITVDKLGNVDFRERTFDGQPTPYQEVCESFSIRP